MRKELAASAVLALFVVGMAFSGASQLAGDNDANTTDGDEYENESSNITVEVNSKTQIDVKPEELNFPSMDVGTQDNVSENGNNNFSSLELENIGSEYIDRVWVNATAPNSDPFGTGDPAQYDAGNFLMLKPSSTTSPSKLGNSSTYHFVNRYEYANSWDSNRDDIPSYISASSSGMSGSVSDTYVGRFRAGDEWYFYTIVTGTGGDQCNGEQGGAVLKVGQSVHGPNQFGTVDFTTSGSDYKEYPIVSTSGTYGLAKNSTDGPSGIRLEFSRDDGSDYYREYDVLTACQNEISSLDESDPHVIRTRYNPQAGDVTDLTDGAGERTQFLFRQDSTPGDMLLPGEGLTIDTAVHVPQGVPEGGVSDGKVTFFVTSDVDAGPGTVP